MEKIAVFPGSFDPIHLGHMSIIKRALPLFDKIYVAIGVNPDKKSMFDFETRYEWCKQACKNMFPDEWANRKIEVCYYTDLTADFCRFIRANYIIRGLRGGADFEYENMIYHAQKLINPDLETIYFITDSQYIGISSSVVREIFKHKGDVSYLVPIGVDLKLNN
jgi:pantetheine-phosphate adenylyltransferase